MTQPISLLLVDDHALLRDMLCEQATRAPGMHVVGAVGDADEAVRLAAETKPDVVVMDIEMPGRLCFDAARAIQAARPATRVIFLSAFTNDAYVEQALDVGAAGYLTKSESPASVLEAIRAVAGGYTYYSPRIVERMEKGRLEPRATRLSSACTKRLTRRELEVLRYIASSMSEKRIAETMHLSCKTIQCHTTNLKKKLGLRRAVELARYAIKEGIVEP